MSEAMALSPWTPYSGPIVFRGPEHVVAIKYAEAVVRRPDGTMQRVAGDVPYTDVEMRLCGGEDTAAWRELLQRKEAGLCAVMQRQIVAVRRGELIEPYEAP